jgi:hypothetical protein
MNRYESSIPRVTLGIATIAVTATTLAVLVLLPAEMRVYDDPTSTLSGVVTVASASVHTGAASADLDSLGKPISASVPCTMVGRDRAQEL